MVIINSITDVITNSSTSVFIVYAEHNIKSIKDIVNAILAIDSNYTFDDLFDINMSINTDVLLSTEELPEDFKELGEVIDDDNLTWSQVTKKLIEIINSYDSEKKNRLSELLWSYIDENDYDSCVRSPYDGIIITPKSDDDVIKRAAAAIERISDIFNIDFCYG